MVVVFLPLPVLISGIVLGVVLLLIGLSKKNSKLIGWGETLLGLSIFALPMLFFLDKASDTWETFVPSTGDLALLGALAFVGGMSAALGLRNILTQESVPKSATS